MCAWPKRQTNASSNSLSQSFYGRFKRLGMFSLLYSKQSGLTRERIVRRRKRKKKRNKKENGRGKKRKSKKPPPAEHAASSVLAGSVPRTIMVCSAQVPLYSPFKCVCNRYNIINLIIATVFIYFSFLSNAMKLNYLLVIHIFAIFISNLDHLYLQLFYLLFWNLNKI